MTYSKSIVMLALFFLFLTDCGRKGAQHVPIPPNSSPEPIDPRVYDDAVRKNERVYSGNTCKNELENDKSHSCLKQCRTLYRKRQDKCKRLLTEQIDVLEELHVSFLKGPELKKLETEFESGSGPGLNDLQVYLGTSIEAFETVSKGYNSVEAKYVLTWIVRNDDVAQVFRNTDRAALTEVFKKIATTSFDPTAHTVYKPLTDHYIADRQTLLEKTLENGNTEALDLWMLYVLDQNKHCNDTVTDNVRNPNDLQCFKVFCEIGKALNDRDLRSDLLTSEVFYKYLDREVIDGKVNSTAAYTNILTSTSRWVYGSDRGAGQIMEIDDIDDFYVDLCKSRIPTQYAN